MMLVLHLCHSHPARPEARTFPAIFETDDGPSGETEPLVDVDVSALNDFLTENDVDLTGITGTLCGEPGEREFYQHMKGTPVAGEIYSLVSGVVLMLEGCTTESSARLNDLEFSAQNNPDIAEAVTEMIEALETQDNQTTSDEILEIENGNVLLEETVNATIENVMNMTYLLCTMESLIPEEHQIGDLHCQWSKDDTDSEICSLHNGNDVWVQGNVLQAKLDCESRNAHCVGVVLRHNDTSYQLVKECSNLSEERIPQLSPSNSKWFKVCSALQNSALNVTGLSSPIRIRRDTGVEALVTVYEHINYEGESVRLTGMVESLTEGWDTKISSMRFPESGWSVVAFEEPNFQGRQSAYVGDTNWIGSKM